MGDTAQVIHPAEARATDTLVPVRGPDNMGSGKYWLLHGAEFEHVRIRLFVLDGLISVTVISKTMGKRRFTGSSETYDYYVVGSCTGWSFEQMKPYSNLRGRFCFPMCVSTAGFEDFHIVLDKDWSLQLGPSWTQANSGDAPLLGPDIGEHRGNTWRIIGEPQDEFEIVLNFNEQDQRKVLQWHRIDGHLIKAIDVSEVTVLDR